MIRFIIIAVAILGTLFAASGNVPWLSAAHPDVIVRVADSNPDRNIGYGSPAALLTDSQTSNTVIGYDVVGDVGWFALGGSIFRVNAPNQLLIEYASQANVLADTQASSTGFSQVVSGDVGYFVKDGIIYRVANASPSDLLIEYTSIANVLSDTQASSSSLGYNDDTGLGYYSPDKVTICHKGKTITVGTNAVDKHVAKHGDTLGPCP